MSAEQRAAYGAASEITSGPLGIPRNNRNHRKKCSIILDETTAERGARVLEVGCGHGLHAPAYAEAFDSTHIDLSESLVAATRARLSDAPAADVRQMDAMALEFPDDHFDAVVGTAILHHLHDAEAALREWCRVTRPGGDITLMEPNYLFPQAFLTTHLIPEERHKSQMAPWRLSRTLAAVPGESRLEPRIFAPPVDSGLSDRLDAVGRCVPGARWMAQMLLVQIRL